MASRALRAARRRGRGGASRAAPPPAARSDREGGGAKPCRPWGRPPGPRSGSWVAAGLAREGPPPAPAAGGALRRASAAAGAPSSAPPREEARLGPRLEKPPRGLSRSFVLGSGYGALAWLCRAVSQRESRRCCPGAATCHSVRDFACSGSKRVRKVVRVAVGRRFKHGCLHWSDGVKLVTFCEH